MRRMLHLGGTALGVRSVAPAADLATIFSGAVSSDWLSALLRWENRLLRIVHKVLNFAESRGRWQAKEAHIPRS